MVAANRAARTDTDTAKTLKGSASQKTSTRNHSSVAAARRSEVRTLGRLVRTGFAARAVAAMCALYVSIAIGGPFAEIYCLSNDYEQSVGRVVESARRIIEASPLLRSSAKITADRIEFRSTGSFIQAVASDYASFAGANPSLCIFDELWAYTSERSRRLWDEAVPSPTRRVSVRLVVTYSGFEGESEPLESLYKRGMAAPEVAPDLHCGDGIACYWTHRAVAPWQTPAWIEQMRLSLRPNQYLRMIENKWVSTESSFVEMDWWDACVDTDLSPELTDPRLSVWVGVDASTKRDSTAIVAVTFDHTLKKVRLVWHRVFQPSAKDPLDFEATIEATLLELRRRFYVREVRYDPWQMQAVAQRLTTAGIPMVEFAQSVPNLTEASTNLYECIKGRNLIAYPDAEMRFAISRCVAVETSRGWRISKEKASHKIDSIVALAQAALGAVQQGQAVHEYAFTLVPFDKYGTSPACTVGSGLLRRKEESAAPDRAADARKASGRFFANRRDKWRWP
jgi:hypothetical protein